MNNGSRKGGSASFFEILRKSPGIEDVWQVHHSETAGELISQEGVRERMARWLK